jgi:hypothetical protein
MADKLDNTITLRAPTPDDPVAGRSGEMWMRSYRMRAARLERLIDLVAPPVIVSGEVDLIRQSLAAIDVIYGDREARDEVTRLSTKEKES